jgi:hypothetical protein
VEEFIDFGTWLHIELSGRNLVGDDLNVLQCTIAHVLPTEIATMAIESTIGQPAVVSHPLTAYYRELAPSKAIVIAIVTSFH